MISSLRPYSAMKDSGVAWLGEIPAHWEIRRTKTLLAERSEKGAPDEPLLAATQTMGVVRKEQYENRTVVAMKDLHLLKLVRIGDFVVSLRSFQGGIEHAREQGIISPAYTILYPIERAHQPYLAQVFKSKPYIDNLSLYVTGIRQGQNVDYEKLARSQVALPPLREQLAITRFLDYAVQRIQRYISTKEELIALLEEQEQATIDHAITGQINPRTGEPHAAYRQVQVAWLGKVPEHWRVVRLKEAAEVQTGLTLGKDYRKSATVTRPYLRVANVQHGHLDLTEIKQIDVPLSEARRSTLSSGDVLMTEGGDIDKLGRGCLWDSEVPGCLHQNHVFAVRCDREILAPEFLVGLMRSHHGRAYFQLTAKQTTNLASTNSTTVRAFPIPLPPVDEQLEILDKVSTETRTIQAAMNRTVREIELVREYRACLIDNIVTGKLDVREAAAALPEVEHANDENRFDAATREMIDAGSAQLDDRVEVA